LIGESSRRLPEHGFIDETLVDAPKLLILIALYLFGPMYESELVGVLGYSWGRLSSHLSSLEKAGYVERRVLARDRPRVLVSITKAGSASLIETLNSLAGIREKIGGRSF
jgi:DNA-binding MarR family transcriptional regulator